MRIGDMTGKVALVTGAASGLGRSSALKLAEAGASVAIVDIDAAALAETAKAIAGLGRSVLALPADLSQGDRCAPLVDEVVGHFGRLDALCNVAGVIYLAHSHAMPPEQYRRTIDINLSAPFLLSRAAIPHLLDVAGAIVNVTSSAAHIGEAYVAAYCASKWGLLGLTKAMAMEYMRQPIRINAVAPGGMMTNIAVNFRPPEGAEIDLIKRYSPLRGLVEVEDVAAMVAFLASPAARSFHGACIDIDAGQSAG